MEEALKKAHDSLEEKVKERTEELQTAYDLLKKSESNLAEAQEIAHLGSWERDFASKEYSWSDEMYRIFGLKPQESKVNYGTFLDYVHPDDRNYVNNAVKETLNGKPLDINFRIIRANGEERIVHALAEVVFDEKSNPIQIIGTTQDITEIKKIEEALRKSEKRYRLLHDSLRDAFAEVTMDGQVIDFNDQFCEILGYSSDEIRTMSFKDLTPDRWHDFEDKIIRKQVIPHGYSEIYEKEYRRKDGTIFPVELRTILSVDDAGQPISMWAIVRDITERKIAEEKFRLSEERYRSFIQNVRGIAFQIDKNFNLEFIHGAVKEITGYSEEELFLYNSWEQLVLPEDIDMFLETERKAAQSPGNFHGEIEYRIRTKDGKIKWMHELHQKISEKNGRPEKYIGLIYDITEKKEIEKNSRRI
jgi:PAS domain S-box-containing protein